MTKKEKEQRIKELKIKRKKEYTKSKEWSDRYFGNLKKGILPF